MVTFFKQMEWMIILCLFLGSFSNEKALAISDIYVLDYAKVEDMN